MEKPSADVFPQQELLPLLVQAVGPSAAWVWDECGVYCEEVRDVYEVYREEVRDVHEVYREKE